MTHDEFAVDLIGQTIPFRSPNPLEDPREHRLRLVERLGGGTYGEVYRAVEEPEDGVGGGETFAVKYYVDETRTVTEEGLGCTTIRELTTVSTCGTHPNLVRMRYLFIDQLPRLVESINQQRIKWARRQQESASGANQEQLRRDLQAQLSQEELKQTQVFVFAAYELCEGGDLKKLLAKHREAPTTSGVSPAWGLPLRHAKMLAFQLLNGLAFLHNEKLCHRDLKPDNLMLTSESENCVLKIGDLGLCRSFRANAGEVTPTVCTIYYRPLEVLLGRMRVDDGNGNEEQGMHYGLGADIWGAGCIIAEMLRGIPLFKGTQEFEVLIRVTKILGTPTEAEWTNCQALQHYPFSNRGESHFFSEHDKRANLNAVLFGKLDLDGLDLLARMLDFNPHTRISAQEALSHQWFTDVAFGQLDGMGVYNWFVDVLKFRLGEKTYAAMEKHTPGCLSTCKVSYVLCQRGYRGAVIQRIDRVFAEIGGFQEPEQSQHWKQVVAAEKLARARRQRKQAAGGRVSVSLADQENAPSRANIRSTPYPTSRAPPRMQALSTEGPPSAGPVKEGAPQAAAAKEEGAGPPKTTWAPDRGVASMLFSDVPLAGSGIGSRIQREMGLLRQEQNETQQPVDSASMAAAIVKASQEMGDLPPLRGVSSGAAASEGGRE
ncbi:hypothetical protein ACSSS7_003281 [Eimeria intestinalis]